MVIRNLLQLVMAIMTDMNTIDHQNRNDTEHFYMTYLTLDFLLIPITDLAGGVAEGKDDRLLIERGHVLQQLGCEHSSNGRSA